jgi:hypothetical protein
LGVRGEVEVHVEVNVSSATRRRAEPRSSFHPRLDRIRCDLSTDAYKCDRTDIGRSIYRTSFFDVAPNREVQLWAVHVGVIDVAPNREVQVWAVHVGVEVPVHVVGSRSSTGLGTERIDGMDRALPARDVVHVDAERAEYASLVAARNGDVDMGLGAANQEGRRK